MLPKGFAIVQVTDSFCVTSDSVYIPYIAGSVADFSLHPGVAEMPDPIIQFRDESSGNPVAWYWDFGDSRGSSQIENPSYKYAWADSFRVMLRITDADGCLDSTYRTVLVRDFQTLYLANSFTPDGDGLNDWFGPIGENLEVEFYEMFIFNRWGHRIFHTTEFRENWNGRMQNTGDMVPRETYVYKILIKTAYQPLREYKGTVTLF
jgi:gliding motility-associated-like protein